MKQVRKEFNSQYVCVFVTLWLCEKTDDNFNLITSWASFITITHRLFPYLRYDVIIVRVSETFLQ